MLLVDVGDGLKGLWKGMQGELFRASRLRDMHAAQDSRCFHNQVEGADVLIKKFRTSSEWRPSRTASAAAINIQNNREPAADHSRNKGMKITRCIFSVNQL